MRVFVNHSRTLYFLFYSFCGISKGSFSKKLPFLHAVLSLIKAQIVSVEVLIIDGTENGRFITLSNGKKYRYFE